MGTPPSCSWSRPAESLMERRLSEIPTEEWGDLSIDVTPREYVLDYLNHGFPTQLYEALHGRERHPAIPARHG